MEVIKAYEIFRSCGLDVSSLWDKGSKSTTKENNVEGGIETENTNNSLLLGDTKEQLFFLASSQIERIRTIGVSCMEAKLVIGIYHGTGAIVALLVQSQVVLSCQSKMMDSYRWE